MDEQDLPIDIHYNKLLDWLIDRRHCDRRWITHVLPIRECVSECLQQLPEGEDLAGIRNRQPFHYFHCQTAFETVKLTDGDTRTLFGKYTSPRVQNWADILKMYSTKNAYLAECAQLLIRNVNYEIPALKQGLSRSQQQQRDCAKKEAESRATAASLTDKFLASCRDMGIKGQNVQEELLKLPSELPDIFQQTVAALPPLEPVMKFYKAFIHHCTERWPDEQQFLPMLTYIMEKGNVTVYQWKHGVEPKVIEEVGVASQMEGVSKSDDNDVIQIDWGDLSQPTPTDTVSGQEELAEKGMETIDWDGIEALDVSGIVTMEEGGEGEGQAPEPSHQGDEDSSPSHQEGGASHQGGGDSTVAEGDLESLLAFTKTRNLFLDDVMELKEFFGQRVRELSRETTNIDIFLAQFDSDSDALLRHQTSESAAEMLGHVTSVLNILSNSRTQQLFLIKNSAHYLERLAGSLLSFRHLAQKAITQAEAMASRKEEATKTGLSLQPKLETLIAGTKQLQQKLEEDISHRYNNRVVNIMGKINMI